LFNIMRAAVWLLSSCALAGFGPGAVRAFDYEVVSVDSMTLTDNTTQISNLQTIFINDVALVSVSDLAWDYTGMADGDDGIVWKTYVNGELQDEGFYNLSEVGRALPTSLEVGYIVVGSSK
jgi:hypothetical protein